MSCPVCHNPRWSCAECAAAHAWQDQRRAWIAQGRADFAAGRLSEGPGESYPFVLLGRALERVRLTLLAEECPEASTGRDGDPEERIGFLLSQTWPGALGSGSYWPGAVEVQHYTNEGWDRIRPLAIYQSILQRAGWRVAPQVWSDGSWYALELPIDEAPPE
jgi:hypothetical protein